MAFMPFFRVISTSPRGEMTHRAHVYGMRFLALLEMTRRECSADTEELGIALLLQ